MHLLLFFALACTPSATPTGDGAPDSATSTPSGDDGTDTPPNGSGDVVLTGARLPGADTPTDLLLSGGRIAAMGDVGPQPQAQVVDLTGRWIAPAFIDSHVHLAYLARGEDLLNAGVAGAVDLAAPIASIGADQGALRTLWAGPMITAVGGYPTTSWGAGGYGLEVADAEAATAAVHQLADSGVGLIKIPMGGSPGLSAAAVEATVAAAHGRGLVVACHCLDDATARAAADAGVDVLAHTPVRALSADTVAAWRGRAVVTSLVAFGAADDTLANLTALRDGGVTVLYGTDFGNTRTAAIQADELRRMADAGLSGAQILAAGTSAPASFWSFEGLGEVTVGAAASLLVLAADPHQDPVTLADPVQVWIDGVATP